MTQSMVERVALGLRQSDLGADAWALMTAEERAGWYAAWEGWKTSDPWLVEKWMKLARAAIQAMREPTEDMHRAMCRFNVDHDEQVALYQTAIDEALRDG